METVTDFIFLSSKFPADGDCRHEVKRCLLLGRKDMTNLDSTLKRRDITLWEIDGETVETVSDFIFGGAPKSLQMVTAAMKLKDACSLEEKL